MLWKKYFQELRELVDPYATINTKEIIKETVKYISFLEKENDKLQRELDEARADAAYYDRRYCDMLVTIRKLKK